MATSPSKNAGPSHVTKKCHECYTYVPLDAEECPYCKVRLGKVTRSGMARRITDWKAYIAFAIALLFFLVFCRYAFFD
jgi:RNA polymerase subunit RPABC4/transcription elongation factor Spt4